MAWVMQPVEERPIVKARKRITVRADRAPILVGTTSWTEATLLSEGDFYPSSVTTPEERLRHYASVFPIVEVDRSFYALPEERNAKLRVQRTANGFVFDVKSFRLFTQHKTPVASLPADVRSALPAGQENVYYADPAVWEVTCPDVAVFRLHGRNQAAGQKKDLASASERFEVHVLFNNCHSDWAQRDAARFREMLGRAAVSIPAPQVPRRLPRMEVTAHG
jgi:uncharacterized protein YecE (DUF72 family)